MCQADSNPLRWVAPGHFSFNAFAVKLLLPKHRPSWETRFHFLLVLTNEFWSFQDLFFPALHSFTPRKHVESSRRSLPLLDSFGTSTAFAVSLSLSFVVRRRRCCCFCCCRYLYEIICQCHRYLCVMQAAQHENRSKVHSHLSETISWHQTSNSMGPEWSYSAPTERMTETAPSLRGRMNLEHGKILQNSQNTDT